MRLVPASGAVAGEADKVGLRFLVWRQRWFSFGGGSDNNFRSFRGSVSYLCVFLMPGYQISLVVGDRLVSRVSHSNGQHNRKSTNRRSTCESASSGPPSVSGTNKSRQTVAVSSANNSTTLPSVGRYP